MLFYIRLKLLKFVGHLPENASRFVVAYGFCTIFDPLFILLVDMMAHNYDCSNASKACKENYLSNDCNCFEADSIKLWHRFQEEEGSGVVGAIITVIIYIGTCTMASLLLYEYLMHVHKDARILDLWRRITANEEEFFMPHDFEISRDELLRVSGEKMRRWRGLDGSRRRLEVKEYSEAEDGYPSVEQTTTYYAIYEETPDKSRKRLHRHFLVLPQGQIIEIFDKLFQPNLHRKTDGQSGHADSLPKLIDEYRGPPPQSTKGAE